MVLRARGGSWQPRPRFRHRADERQAGGILVGLERADERDNRRDHVARVVEVDVLPESAGPRFVRRSRIRDRYERRGDADQERDERGPKQCRQHVHIGRVQPRDQTGGASIPSQSRHRAEFTPPPWTKTATGCVQKRRLMRARSEPRTSTSVQSFSFITRPSGELATMRRRTACTRPNGSRAAL